MRREASWRVWLIPIAAVGLLSAIGVYSYYYSKARAKGIGRLEQLLVNGEAIVIERIEFEGQGQRVTCQDRESLRFFAHAFSHAAEFSYAIATNPETEGRTLTYSVSIQFEDAALSTYIYVASDYMYIMLPDRGGDEGTLFFVNVVAPPEQVQRLLRDLTSPGR